MGLFGKSKKELENENKLLREMLAKQANSAPKSASKPKPPRKVLYQCRYCGVKAIQNANEGAPFVGAKCPRHPKGWCKGLHSFQRTFL